MSSLARGAPASWWRRAGILAALLCLGTTGYYALEVLRARAATPDILRAALADPGMVLSPDDLSAAQRDALIAVQDPDFFTHKGWNFAGGTVTTITQSLVKRYYFDDFRPGISKIRQSLIARLALDPLVSKQDQLTLFINIVYLGTIDGRAVNGLAEGARVFFGKGFGELSWDEYLSLLASFSAPDRLNPLVDPAGNSRRVAEIKQLLATKRIAGAEGHGRPGAP